MNTTLPNWPGWHLLGAFPDNEPDDVGSWLLHHNGEALLLEIPEGLSPSVVDQVLGDLNLTLKYVTASHDHADHLDVGVWRCLRNMFPQVKFICPRNIVGDYFLRLGGEPLWLIGAPKHSYSDTVTVFRGAAMLGDIELGMLESVNDEVPDALKKHSMAWLQGFQSRSGYRVHSTVSAHLNDMRTDVDWPTLFTYRAPAYYTDMWA